ncbi:hypothetical protein QNI19_35350 [Cytophagaceae bacterium DM2B3-1]|uniref:DoxX family protein n=1 Tax=Xanthocytophaga flava TaxID=3048013 RepID=A0ABT7CX86_9BACT|nr:hypothetical protein [Xanthocytophaga flavus]MDJ1498266.1 hypothetical protein [Xanthocytophaga flavus]
MATSDKVANQLNGFELTWLYFGYSYSLALTIGLIQLIGAIVVLYKRSSLLGLFFLLPTIIITLSIL